jgi:hypothetical protein
VANVHRDPESCSDVIVTVVPLHILAVSLCTELNIPFIHLETVETQAGHSPSPAGLVWKRKTHQYTDCSNSRNFMKLKQRPSALGAE